MIFKFFGSHQAAKRDYVISIHIAYSVVYSLEKLRKISKKGNLVFDVISRLVPRVIVCGHALKDIFLLVPVQWSVVGGQSMVPFFREKKFRLFLTDSADMMSWRKFSI